MKDEARDPFGTYKSAVSEAVGTDDTHGPGPDIMGATP